MASWHPPQKSGAMDYTIVMASTASEAPAVHSSLFRNSHGGVLYVPGKGCSDRMICLSMRLHTAPCPLPLERSRDVKHIRGCVYLHSRLLERSSRLSDAKEADPSRHCPLLRRRQGRPHIPTNVIFPLQTDRFSWKVICFFRNETGCECRPFRITRWAVSRQKAMKKASGSIRIDLAQYREMEVFTQFSSDLDESTKEQWLTASV